MEPYWTKDMVYDTNYVNQTGVLGNSTGLRAWFDHEHVPWNIAFHNATFSQLIFAGEELTATTTTYATALWAKDLAGIPANGKTVTIRIFDFYKINGEQKKIAYNWMLLDLVGLIHQSGPRVLPKPKLREGWVQGPRAMDGLPAPITMFVDPTVGPKAKAVVSSIIASQFENTPSPDSACDFLSDDFIWYGPEGFGVAYGCSSYYQHVLAPLYEAFPVRSVDVDVLTCESAYCGVHGVITAVQTGEWLGVPATNRTVHLRFGFHYRVDLESNTAADAWAIFDLPKAFADMGVDLFRRSVSKVAADGMK